jgi:hypothetical protein
VDIIQRSCHDPTGVVFFGTVTNRSLPVACIACEADENAQCALPAKQTKTDNVRSFVKSYKRTKKALFALGAPH